MKKVLKAIFLLFFLLVIAAGVAVYFGFQQYQAYTQQSITLPSDTQIFEIKKGSHIRKVSRQLEKENILKPAWQFELLARVTGQASKIKAGEFQLKKDMKPADVLKTFTDGKGVQYKASIVEGKTFKELVATLKTNKDLVHTLSDDDYKYENIMAKIGSDKKNPEGWFFPDTYFFPSGTTDVQFLQRAHEQMKQYLQQAWEGRQKEKSLKTPYQMLIMSSLVEKETGDPKDRTSIARVFYNRLDMNMRLQTDPTVIYGMGDKYKGNIRKRDLKKDTPYNTYTRYGLTPTPIAIPSKAAIEAVMKPKDGKMLYFVAKGDGTSYFSNSYREHRKAVIKYLLGGNAKRYKGDK